MCGLERHPICSMTKEGILKSDFIKSNDHFTWHLAVKIDAYFFALTFNVLLLILPKAVLLKEFLVRKGITA